ncbi:MAG: putative RDD family membrane protein YckC [Myxococcota bacterium]|jgi:uncharacterized RDD family membrane protein YckC
MFNDDENNQPGQSFNPYAPPAQDAEAPNPSWHQPEARRQAPRGKRFAGNIVDTLIAWPVLLYAMVIEDETLTLIGGVIGLMVSCVQWYLITTSGQSIAKRMFDMQIIRTDGSPVDFRSGVMLRSWLPGLIGALPFVGLFFGLADGAAIFGDTHQCIHDRIADTQVIDLTGG